MAARKFRGAEPTLYDVIDLIQGLQAGFERMDTGLERLEGEMRGMKQEMRVANKRTFKNELRIENVADDVHSHEKRIIVLERWKKNSGKKRFAGA